jgi:hypothetical protein
VGLAVLQFARVFEGSDSGFAGLGWLACVAFAVTMFVTAVRLFRRSRRLP